MEAWLEYILILAVLALSIASISASILLYISLKKASIAVARGKRGYEKPKRSRYIKRYLLFRIYRIKGETSFEELDSCFKDSVAELLGIMEDRDRVIKLIRYDAQSGAGIARIVSTDIYKVIFAISRIRRCGDSVIIVMPTLVTGTLKKAISRAHEYEDRYR